MSGVAMFHWKNGRFSDISFVPAGKKRGFCRLHSRI
jgi:hypothetical protein